MKRFTSLFGSAVVLAVMLSLAGCGSGNGYSSGGGSSSTSGNGYSSGSGSSSSSASGSAAVVVKEVSEKYAFTPASISVSKGTKVTWQNKTDAEHSVTFTSGATFDKEFEKGESVSFTFTKTGTFQYHCKYHPYMTGTVTVH